MGIKVGQYFVELGIITENNVSEALEYQKKRPGYLGEILLQLEMIKEDDLLHYLSKRFNIQYVSSEKIERMPIQRPADVIPEKMAIEKNIFPLKYSFNNLRLTVLTSEPQNTALFDGLKVLLTGVHTVVPVVATANALRALIFKQYRGDMSAFDRLVRRGVDQNLLVPGNESVIGFDSPKKISLSLSVNDMLSDSKEKEEQDKKESFSMIIKQGDIVESNESSSVTASTVLPSWAKEQHGQMVELLRIFSSLLDSVRDDAFFGHTQRVASLSQELGHEMNLSEVELHDLLIAAYLHDIGKKHHITAMDIKHNTNPARLVKYSQLGSKLFGSVELSKLTLDYLSNIYETYNGAGLPNGLQLNEVPMGSLILLISDTFDAMTRVSNIPAPVVFKQIKELMFFPEKLLSALKKVQQLDSMPASSSSPQLEALIISKKRFDIDDIAEKLNRLNVKTYKAEKVEKAAQIIKEKKNTLNFILCDIDIPDSSITPLNLLAAIKHKQGLSEIPFFFFSTFSIEKNVLTTARALKVSGIFSNYHPVEMTRKIIEEIKKLKNRD